MYSFVHVFVYLYSQGIQNSQSDSKIQWKIRFFTPKLLSSQHFAF